MPEQDRTPSDPVYHDHHAYLERPPDLSAELLAVDLSLAYALAKVVAAELLHLKELAAERPVVEYQPPAGPYDPLPPLEQPPTLTQMAIHFASFTTFYGRKLQTGFGDVIESGLFTLAAARRGRRVRLRRRSANSMTASLWDLVRLDMAATVVLPGYPRFYQPIRAQIDRARPPRAGREDWPPFFVLEGVAAPGEALSLLVTGAEPGIRDALSPARVLRVAYYVQTRLRGLRREWVCQELEAEYAQAVAFRLSVGFNQDDRQQQDRSGQPSKDSLATAVLMEHPEWTNAEIAAEVPMNPKSLTRDRCPNFFRAKAAMRAAKGEFPHGFKDSEGDMDAAF